MTEQEQRQRVIDEAMTWLGTPWHHAARIKGAGVDCAMFLAEVYHAAGLLPRIDPGEYPMDWMMHRDEERFLSWVEQYAKIKKSPKRGDMVIFRFGRTFSHGGVLLDDERIIHAYRENGMVVLGEINQGRLADRERRFYSLWGK